MALYNTMQAFILISDILLAFWKAWVTLTLTIKYFHTNTIAVLNSQTPDLRKGIASTVKLVHNVGFDQVVHSFPNMSARTDYIRQSPPNQTQSAA